MTVNDCPDEDAPRSPTTRDLLTLSEDETLGDWLHAELTDLFDVEDDPWAVGLAERVAARLNRARVPAPPLKPVLLWVATFAAFTAPGGYLYLTRGLLHRAWWEEAVAFIAAHEMAHHDLGHMAHLRRLGWARRLPGAFGAATVLALGERLLCGPEHEAAADARALDLCLAAGYDGEPCIAVFDVMEDVSLEYGDIEGVFGPEELIEAATREKRLSSDGLQTWIWQRFRGYPRLLDRREALIRRLQEKG